MSDTGLYSGLYSTVRKLAELVDTVILDIKSEQSNYANVDQRKLLGTLLTRLGDQSQSDLTSSILTIIVRDSGRSLNAQELGNSLLQGGTGHKALEKLEILAAILESERSTMLSKMRGQG